MDAASRVAEYLKLVFFLKVRFSQGVQLPVPAALPLVFPESLSNRLRLTQRRSSAVDRNQIKDAVKRIGTGKRRHFVFLRAVANWAGAAGEVILHAPSSRLTAIKCSAVKWLHNPRGR